MKTLTLSQLSDIIEASLEKALPTTYWVVAEIASMSEKSGHLYLDLVEKGERGLMVARQRATCWQNRQQMLQIYFEQETGTRLQAGLQVLVEVEVHFHSVYGLSLNIVNIDPRFTVGDLARQRQETILRLKKDGVLEMQQGLVLPTIVRRLAVISAVGAAGYGDFCDQLNESSYTFHTTLFEAVMQGENAEQSIIAALQQIYDQTEEGIHYDAVIIIRGGGATTDLSCFDQYTLCALCAQFPLPIITGIGHTRDVSVLDLVSHLALKTPTAVAAWLIKRLDGQATLIDELRMRLKQTAQRQIMLRQHRIDLLRQRLESCSPERIYRLGYTLLTANGKVVRSVQDVQKGQTITSHLLDGQIQSIVQ